MCIDVLKNFSGGRDKIIIIIFVILILINSLVVPLMRESMS